MSSGYREGKQSELRGSCSPEYAEPLNEHFCAELRTQGVPVESGVFGAKMEVELVNDGPVTIVLDG